MCRTCHSLIHEGFLFVTGQAANGLTWLGPDKKPVDSFASHDAPARPRYIREIEPSTCEAAPRGAGLRETSSFGDTTIHSLDDVPDEVSAEWW